MLKASISEIKITQRIRKEVTNIDELAADIQMFGLLNPLTVMKDSSGEYRLLAGLRRLRAVQSIGWTEVGVNIVAPADAEEVIRIEISENEMREPFTFSEKMDFARLLEEIEAAKAKERMVQGGQTAGRGRPIDNDGEKGSVARRYPNSSKASDTIGEKINMSGRTYERAKHIRDNAPQETIDKLDKGESSIFKEYNELRSQGKSESTVAVHNIVKDDENKIESDDCHIEIDDESEYLKSVSNIRKPLSEKDEEAQRKINEFNALPPLEKIKVLQEQLRKERARAAGAESELKRERELHHNTKYHSQLSIVNLEGQVADLTTKVVELTDLLAKINDR